MKDLLQWDYCHQGVGAGSERAPPEHCGWLAKLFPSLSIDYLKNQEGTKYCAAINWHCFGPVVSSLAVAAVLFFSSTPWGHFDQRHHYYYL